MTLVLGIDPGLTRCGVGLIRVGTDRRCVLESVEVVRTNPTQAPMERVGLIAVRVRDVLLDNRPDAIAIERVFAQANLKTVMGTAQISGAVLYLAYESGIPVFTYTPTQVKASVTGSGRAPKEQVGKMVAKVLGLEEVPKPADAADALAIAITHAWSGAAASGTSGLQTPAQKAWAAAERAAKGTR